MSYLDNIAFSMECQAFTIQNPIFDYQNHALRFHAHSRTTIFDTVCPHCGSHHIHQNKIYTRSIQGVPFDPELHTIIHTDVKSFECQECKKVFSEEIPFLYPGTRITNTLARWIKAMLGISSFREGNFESLFTHDDRTYNDNTLKQGSRVDKSLYLLTKWRWQILFPCRN